MPDTGFEAQPWLVKKDGRFVQVSELLYRLLERCDGVSTSDQVAGALTADTPWSVTEENVTYLLRTKLSPLGLVDLAGGPGSTHDDGEADGDEKQLDGAELGRTPAAPGRRSALAVNLRSTLLGPRAIDAVGGLFRFLFLPPVAAVALATVAVAQGWVFFVHGLGGSVAETLNRPAALLVLVGIVVVAALFHEFGHAAALRYGGGHPRRLGFGFYVIFPAFYTDVTEAYTLPRRARVRTDLGGPYFHLLVSGLVVGAYFVTRQEYLLLLVLLIDVEVLRQFIPFLRLDGYWLLADLAGVPDFFSQAGPFLRRTVQRRGTGERLPALRRSVKVTFVVFLVVTFLVLPALLVVGLIRLPHIGELAWAALARHGAALRQAWDAHQALQSAALVVTMILVLLQLAGLVAFVYLFVIRPILRAWSWTAAKPAGARSALRSSLELGVGGIALVLGTLYPWRRVGPMGGGDITGLSTHLGPWALGCGVGAVGVAVLALLVPRLGLRRAVAVVGLVLGVSGAVLAAMDLARTRGAVDHAIRQSVQQTTGREASAAEVRRLRAVAAGLGITVAPGFGVIVAMGGGGAAAVGAASVLVRSRRRRRREGSAPEGVGAA
jgi:putative peptide zinc metalloprotease protein